MRNNLARIPVDTAQTNLVYRFTCPFPHRQVESYIGNTRTTLSRRLTMHIQHGAITQDLFNAHSYKPTHKFLVQNTAILLRETKPFRLYIKEALAITMYKPSINKQFHSFNNILRLFGSSTAVSVAPRDCSISGLLSDVVETGLCDNGCVELASYCDASEEVDDDHTLVEPVDGVVELQSVEDVVDDVSYHVKCNVIDNSACMTGSLGDVVDAGFSDNRCVVLALSDDASKEVGDDSTLVEHADCDVDCDLQCVEDVYDVFDQVECSVLDNSSGATGQDVLTDGTNDDGLFLSRLAAVMHSDNITVRRKR